MLLLNVKWTKQLILLPAEDFLTPTIYTVGWSRLERGCFFLVLRIRSICVFRCCCFALYKRKCCWNVSIRRLGTGERLGNASIVLFFFCLFAAHYVYDLSKNLWYGWYTYCWYFYHQLFLSLWKLTRASFICEIIYNWDSPYSFYPTSIIAITFTYRINEFPIRIPP